MSWVEIGFLLLASATKFLSAVIYIISFNNINTLSTFLILVVGGSCGTIIFFYFGELIIKIIDYFWKKKKDKKTFSRMNRFIIKIKSGYGLIGLALLTPILFSIPLGCFLAARFFDDKKATLPIMLSAVLFWSIVFTSIKYLRLL